MFYIYIIQSKKDKSYYTGCTEDLKNRIATITYKIDDYFNYGTPLPAEDRAFLSSLGISF